MTTNNISLSSNLEDYLEVIFHLQAENRVARAKDVADALHVSRASVTGALKSLAERDLINYEPYSFVTLTSQGEKIAREIIRRHSTLKDFFQNFLKLSAKTAEENACRVEHAIDTEAMNRLISFLEFTRNCPRSGQDWLESFNHYCRHGIDKNRCVECMEHCAPEKKD